MSKSTAYNMQSVTSNAVASALSQQCCVSQVLFAGGGAYGTNYNSAQLGAYGYSLIAFQGLSVPTGFHKEYILSAQVTTDGSINIRARLNNIATSFSGTWSTSSFRITTCSEKFKDSDITLEPTYQYSSQNGINLYIETDSGYGNAYIYNITLTCFIVKD